MGFSLEQVVSPVTNELWCASATTKNYVNMTFTEQVVVEGIISSGRTSPGNVHFVSNLSILFSRDINVQLQLYGRVYAGMITDHACTHVYRIIITIIAVIMVYVYIPQSRSSLSHHQVYFTMSVSLSLLRNSSSGLMDMDQTNCFAGK